MKFKIGISFLLLLTGSRSFAQTSQPLLGLDSFADSVLKTFHVAGFAVAVVKNSRVIYAKGFGYRDVEKKLPVTERTVFPIASCTKAFTASLLGVLSAEGKLDLDQPVRKYMPELRFLNDYTTDHVTSMDMLTHRTGLPRHDQLEYFFDKSLPRDSLVYRIRYLEPTTELRYRVQYNNLMYITLGVLSEKLTGLSWEQNIQKRLLTPLQMNESSFNYAGWLASPEHALGYYRKNNLMMSGNPDDDPLNGPAGGLNASVNDLAKWLIAWIGGGKYQDNQVIPAAFISQATRPQMVNGNSTYGLGWVLTTFLGGHYKLDHGGDLPLFSSSVCFFPNQADSLGIVVLANQFGGYVTGLVRDYIADCLLNSSRPDLKPVDWFGQYQKMYDADHQPDPPKPAASKPVAALSHTITAYTGKYLNPGYGTIQIGQQADSLAGIFNKTPLSLRHFDADIFVAKPGGKLTFQADGNGGIGSIAMHLEENVKPIIFVRIK